MPALRGVDLDLAAGRLIMLMGPSGCGKTTLVSVISGVLDADAGQVELFGVNWATLSTDQKTRRRAELVGFVFQQFNLVPTLTAAENTAVPLLIRGVPFAEAIDRAGALLSDLGLGDRTAARPAELSGGMQQRVAIARALATQPRLLVCDEPTANLDGSTGQSVMELIRRASLEHRDQAQERCVVVVTHDSRVTSFADQIEEMEDGRITTAGGNRDSPKY